MTEFIIFMYLLGCAGGGFLIFLSYEDYERIKTPKRYSGRMVYPDPVEIKQYAKEFFGWFAVGLSMILFAPLSLPFWFFFCIGLAIWRGFKLLIRVGKDAMMKVE